MNKSLFLQAFDGTNTTVPVWFMRQAGRYLPEYQKIRAQYPLEEMFKTPELAAQITCMPIDILGVDAAILFADILTLPSEMGYSIYFDNKKGPVIDTKATLHDFEDLSYIANTIKLIKQQLPDNIPLIGFAGGPFTVLTYLLEGGSSINFPKTFRFCFQETSQMHEMLSRLTTNTINYLKLQQEAGIDAFQIFDTWAGMLRPTDYADWVLPYIQEIFKQIDLPSIYFAKNSHHLLSLMDQSKANFLSVDHTVALGHQTILEKTKKGIQGNLFNGLLYSDLDALKRETHDILIGAQKHEKFIFNLNHGILPDMDAEKLKFIVKEVHNFSWKS